MNKRYIIATVIVILALAGGFYVWNGVSKQEKSKVTNDSWTLPSNQDSARNQTPEVNQDDSAPQSRNAIFTTVTLSDEVIKSFEINPNEPEWFGFVTYNEQNKKATYYNPALNLEVTSPSIYSYTVGASRWSKDQSYASTIRLFDPNDTSTYEFHVLPVSINALKQESTAGRVYLSTEEYVKNMKYLNEHSHEFVSINAVTMAYFEYEKSDAEDAPINMYLFVKDELVYEIYINANNPDAKIIVESIRFR